jgi:hypothetical protein
MGRVKNILIYSVIGESQLAESLHPGLDDPAEHNVLLLGLSVVYCFPMGTTCHALHLIIYSSLYNCLFIIFI